MATTSKSRSRRKAPAVHITLAKFDTRDPVYRVVREGVPIADFVPLTAVDYQPSGGTPLRDAVARMIGHGDELRGSDHVSILLLADESGSMAGNRDAVILGINQFVDGMSDVKAVDPKTAGTVLAVIVTDGYENASREVDHPTLQKMVSDREADGWTFIFLGANIDAWAQGANLGFSGGATGQSVNYVSTPTGLSNAMGSITTDSASYLADSGSYAKQRATTSNRSIMEDGTETTANTGGTPVPPPSTFAPPTNRPYDVEEAIRQAKDVTSS